VSKAVTTHRRAFGSDVAGEQPLDVLRQHVDLDVHVVAGLLGAQRRDRGGVRDDGDRERVDGGGHDGETDAVDRDRSLLHHVPHECDGDADAQIGHWLQHLPDAVDVTLHQVAAEAIGQPYRTLQVQRRPDCDAVQAGACERLVAHVGFPPVGALLDDRQAATVDRDRVAEVCVLEHDRGRDPYARSVQRLDAADLFHDSCEHGPVLSSRCRALGVQVHGNANKTAEPPVRVRTWRRDRIACVDPAPIRTVTVGPGITPGRPHTMLLCEVRGLSPPIGNFTQPRRGFFSCWPQR
jgi:hypothetical protein